jgi:hypothetical protein
MPSKAILRKRPSHCIGDMVGTVQLPILDEIDVIGVGDFVRIGHNEVSVGHPDAINEVLKSHMDKVYLHKFINGHTRY